LYNTPEGIQTGVIGLYKVNREIYSIGPNENATTLYFHAIHDLVIPRVGYISIIGQFDPNAFNPNTYGAVFTQRIWRHHYKVIDRANALITAAEEVEGMDAADKQTGHCRGPVDAGAFAVHLVAGFQKRVCTNRAHHP
jgi:hypothetical protein